MVDSSYAAPSHAMATNHNVVTSGWSNHHLPSTMASTVIHVLYPGDVPLYNARFAESEHQELPFLPRKSALVLTCVDHRVDPAHVLGIELGEAVVIRNGGGRWTGFGCPSISVIV